MRCIAYLGKRRVPCCRSVPSSKHAMPYSLHSSRCLRKTYHLYLALGGRDGAAACCAAAGGGGRAGGRAAHITLSTSLFPSRYGFASRVSPPRFAPFFVLRRGFPPPSAVALTLPSPIPSSTAWHSSVLLCWTGAWLPVQPWPSSPACRGFVRVRICLCRSVSVGSGD